MIMRGTRACVQTKVRKTFSFNPCARDAARHVGVSQHVAHRLAQRDLQRERLELLARQVAHPLEEARPERLVEPHVVDARYGEQQRASARTGLAGTDELCARREEAEEYKDPLDVSERDRCLGALRRLGCHVGGGEARARRGDASAQVLLRKIAQSLL